MDKFKDVEVGTKILIPVGVTTGNRNINWFLVEKEIEIVTDTQFVADGVRYQKRWGHIIGGDYFPCAKKRTEGEDQTTELREFRKDLHAKRIGGKND